MVIFHSYVKLPEGMGGTRWVFTINQRMKHRRNYWDVWMIFNLHRHEVDTLSNKGSGWLECWEKGCRLKWNRQICCTNPPAMPELQERDLQPWVEPGGCSGTLEDGRNLRRPFFFLTKTANLVANCMW